MTQDEIIRMAREAGFNSDEFDNADCPCEECNWLRPMIERFAALVAAHEREACAKVCDTYFEERLGTGDQEFGFGAYDCSNIIKSRGGL